MKIHKTEKEVFDDKVRMAVEKTVIWFVRWSQVLFWFGFAVVICLMAYLCFNTRNSAYALWEQIIMYSTGIIGAVTLIFGTVVWVQSLFIDERAKKGGASDE